MKIYYVLFLACLCGCADLMGYKDPRPTDSQIEANKQIADKATAGIVKVYEAKLNAMGEAGKEITKHNVSEATAAFRDAVKDVSDPAARANMFSNYGKLVSNLTEERSVVESIASVDSVQENIKGVGEYGIKSTKTSPILFGMHTAGVTAGVMAGKEDFENLASWTIRDLLPYLAGGIGGGGGIIAGLVIALSKLRNRNRTLATGGQVIEKHGSDTLKTELAKSYSKMKGAKKEYAVWI